MGESAPDRPLLSLIVPTRARTVPLRRMLDSLQATASNPHAFEVLLVVDADDSESVAFRHDGLILKQVVVQPGQTMGALNGAGYAASAGRYLILLNDDIVARTPGWDHRVAACLRGFPDDLVLVHVNDGLFGERLCTFPLVSRTYCELAGGICPRDYVRYRIDDHIEDVFNLLGVLGERRSVYLPEVVFEHLNFTVTEDGRRTYAPNEAALRLDAPLFDALAPERKRLALRLKRRITRQTRRAEHTTWAQRLEAVADPAVLRVPERLRVESEQSPLCSARARVTVGVIASGTRPGVSRRCLAALKAHTRNYELVLLGPSSPSGGLDPGKLNRLLAVAQSDHVVLLNDQVLVGPGWLDGLLAALSGQVALVAPLHRARHESAWHWGLAFHPDGSGHHSHLLSPPPGPGPILGPCGPAFLIDRARCRHLLFDEAYTHAFFDLDFGLRVWEAGYQALCTPAVGVTHLDGGPLPYGLSLDRQRFERDRQRFAKHWFENGRFHALENTGFRDIPALRQLLDLGKAVEGLPHHLPGETPAQYRQRAEAILDSVNCCPILKFAAVQKLGGAGLVGRAGLGERYAQLRYQLAAPARQARRCLEQRGWPGLFQALWSRLLRRLSAGCWYPLPPAAPGIPNATLAARCFSYPRRLLLPPPIPAREAGQALPTPSAGPA